MAIKPVSGEIKAQVINDNLSYLDSSVAKTTARVEQIITTPLEGVNKEEVADARQGGASLGDNLTYITKKFEESLSGSYYFPDIVIGTLSAVDGAETENNKRLRSADFLPQNQLLKIVFDGGVDAKIKIMQYSNEGVFMPVLNFLPKQDFVTDPNYKYKFVIAYEDERVIDSSNINYLKSFLKIEKISRDSVLKIENAFVTGTINAADGEDSSINTRIRTPVFYDGNKFDINFRGKADASYSVFYYKKDGTFEKSTGWIDNESFNLDENRKYKIALKLKSEAILTETDKTYLSSLINVSIAVNKAMPEKNGLVIDAEGFSLKSFIKGIPCNSDHTFVGDELWIFPVSNDTHTNYSDVTRYSLDIDNATYQLLGSFKHNFGHCNTVDYCQQMDCLILGNGSGDYNLSGEFYVIPNASNLKNLETATLDEVAIKFPAETYGTKVNMIWGESNLGRHDIAYMITNDTADIRKVQLGKGANNLGLGSFIDGKAVDEFNGTYKIIRHWSQPSRGYDDCIQGGDFFGGKIYAGIGHHGANLWVQELLKNGAIKRTNHLEEFFSASGANISASNWAIGVHVDDNYIYFGSNQGLMVFNK